MQFVRNAAERRKEYGRAAKHAQTVSTRSSNAIFTAGAVSTLANDIPLKIPFRARTSQQGTRRRQEAHRNLAHFKTGAALTVTADRVVPRSGNTPARVVENKQYEAKLHRRASAGKHDDLLFTFDDDPKQILHSLTEADDQQQIFVHHFAPRLSAVHGLPPVSREVKNTLSQLANNSNTLESVVYCGFSMSTVGAEAATAIVARKKIRPQIAAQLDLNAADPIAAIAAPLPYWSSETDLASPTREWIDHLSEKQHTRLYGGGTHIDIGIITAIAAMRNVRELCGGAQQLQRGNVIRAAIVLEGGEKTFGSVANMLHGIDGKTHNPTTSTGRLRETLKEEWGKISNFTLVVSTHHAFVATNAADMKRRTVASTRGEMLSEEESRYFVNHVASAKDHSQRHKQNAAAAAATNGMADAPEIYATAARVSTVEEFTEICRRCRARESVSSRVKAQWAQILSSVLGRIISLANDAPDGEHTRRLDDAIIALLLLPQAFLPLKGRQEQILQRMAANKHWNLLPRQPQQPTSASKSSTSGTTSATVTVTTTGTTRTTGTAQLDAADDGGDAISSCSTTTTTVPRPALPSSSSRPATTSSSTSTTDTHRDLARAIVATELGATADGQELLITAATTNLAPGQRDAQQAAITKINLLIKQQEHRVNADMQTIGDDHHDERERKLTRLAEAVERLACDLKIRSAVKLIMQTVDNMEDGHIDLDFDTKLAALRAKFIPRMEVPDRSADADTTRSKLCPPFDANRVNKVLSKMPTQAASCIEAWNPRLMTAAIDVIPAIADQLGHVLSLIINGRFSDRVNDILRLGRLVAIPKPPAEGTAAPPTTSTRTTTSSTTSADAAAAATATNPTAPAPIRPITLTAFICKLIGSLAFHMHFGGRRPHLDGQYAVGAAEGVQRVAHAVRAEREKGAAVVRLDISNAFGTCQRHHIAALLNEMSDKSNVETTPSGTDNNEDATAVNTEYTDNHEANYIDSAYLLKRYWNLMYGSTSAKLAVYGPSGRTEFIDVNEGVRQGDSNSTYLFCLIMDKVRTAILARLPHAKVRVYVDDMTITVPPQHARHVMHVAMQEFERVGLTCNPTKSSILANDPRAIAAYPWKCNQAVDAAATTAAPSNKFTFPKNNAPNALNITHLVADSGKLNYRRKYPEGYEKCKKHEIPPEVREQTRKLETEIANLYLDVQYKTMMRHADNIDTVFGGDEEDEAALRATDGFKMGDINLSFIVLGANISNHFDEYNTKQLAKIKRFFDVLRLVGLHEQLAFTLARISGFMRPRFYASVTPPQHAAATVNSMMDAVYQYMQDLLKIPVTAKCPYTHCKQGLGIPDYNSHQTILYQEAYNTVLGYPQQEVELVNVQPGQESRASAAHLRAQTNAPWLFYAPRGQDDYRLTSPEFRLAMAIRCGAIPDDIAETCVASCTCTNIELKTPLDIIAHALNCNNSGFTTATRHNFIKTAIARVLRHYNFAVTLEPTVYSSYYEDSVAHRPDVLVHTSPPICTDVTVVQQNDSSVVGNASRAAAKRKSDHHNLAVSRIGHVFYPFALEAHGYEQPCNSAFTNAVGSHLPRHELQQLVFDMRSAVSVALARARCQAVSAIYKARDFRVRAPDGSDSGDVDAAEGIAL